MANYTYLSPKELVSLLDDPAERDAVAIVDCRDADRSEGFIAGSIHAPVVEYTAEMYAALATQLHAQQVRYAVFHCALSQVRGPKGAGRFAAAQRQAGLALPNVYVLRGGYEAFAATYAKDRPDLCNL